MKLITTFLLLALLGGCTAERRSPRRFAWVTGLRPEKAAYYKQLHANPWPGVNRMLKECKVVGNYSIHLKEIDGRPYLFSYLEYTGDDWEADMNKMDADPETQRVSLRTG